MKKIKIMIEILKKSVEMAFKKSSQDAVASIDFICDYRDDDAIKQRTLYSLTNDKDINSLQKALNIITEHSDNMIDQGPMKINSETWLEELVKVVGIPRVTMDEGTIRNIIRIDISTSDSIVKN